MFFVKAGPSFPAMIVAENPSLRRSFNRFRRVSVQLTGMRRFLQPGSLAGLETGSHCTRLGIKGPAYRRALGSHQSFVNPVERTVTRTVSRDMTHHDNLQPAPSRPRG